MTNPILYALSVEHARLVRAQRNAYFAWQNCPRGTQGDAFKAYQAASQALDTFNKSAAVTAAQAEAWA